MSAPEAIEDLIWDEDGNIPRIHDADVREAYERGCNTALEAQNRQLRETIKSLLDATPQEQCGEDCDEECCPWMQARAALAATKEKA